jgi:hypothetical protein
MGIATAALDQPGDEGWAYGRAGLDWQRRNDGPSDDLTGRRVPTGQID